MSVTDTGGNALTEKVVCRWLVTAGFEADFAAERFTRKFVVTREDWGGGDTAGRRLRAARRQEALAYVEQLMSDEAFTWALLDYLSHEGPWGDGADG